MSNNQNKSQDDNLLVLHDDEGNEITLEILASRKETEDGPTYALAVDEDDTEVLVLKCMEDENNEEELTFEIIDDEHEDFERVFEMFKEDFETLGISVEDIEFDEE